MKVEFLNEEKTRALLTRGWWLWKKQAFVRRKWADETRWWVYESTDRDCELDVNKFIRKALEWTSVTKQEWISAAKIPEARLLR